MRFLVFVACLSALLSVGSGVARAEPLPGVAPSPAPEPAARVPAEPTAEPEEALPLTPETRAPAEPPEPTPETVGSADVQELLARLATLERSEPLDDSVKRPVDFAKAALERSRASRAAGDAQGELRTLRLAHAALELSEARLRLLRERALFQGTQLRRNAATAEQATAKRALERERARALELQRESAAP